MPTDEIKHAITRTHLDYDPEGNVAYVLTCKCGWKTDSPVELELVGVFIKHLSTEERKARDSRIL